MIFVLNIKHGNQLKSGKDGKSKLISNIAHLWTYI